MSLSAQIGLGSLLLCLCAFAHMGVLSLGIFVLTSLHPKGRPANADGLPKPKRILLILTVGLLSVLAAHTVQIWTWAIAFFLLQLFETFETAFYFASVTYTTVGYGDIIPPPSSRVLITFAAITGMLTFGISTAFLLGIYTRILPKSLNHNGRS